MESNKAEVLSSVLWVSRFQRLSRILSIVVMVLAGVVLFGGYILGVAEIQSLSPGLPKMVPNTAIGLLLSAVSLFIHNSASRQSERRLVVWIEQLLSAAIVCLGIATITEYLFRINLGIDQLFFRDTLSGATYPGRPSPQTSLALIVTGASLLFVGGKRLWIFWAGQILSVTVGFISIVAIVGYVYAALPLYGITPYTGMAIHTAVSFLFISIGMMFAKPDRGLVAVFTSDSDAGRLARRLIPEIIIIPIVLGILTELGRRAGFYSADLASALNAALFIILLGVELWLFTLVLERSSIARSKAIQTMNTYLEQLRVANQELQALKLRTELRVSKQRVFSSSQLREFNGEAGKPVYVAFNGNIYDVSGSRLWKNGNHQTRHHAGDDLTTNITNAPHGVDVLAKFPIVGELTEGRLLKEGLIQRIAQSHVHSMIVHFSIAYTIIAPFLGLLYLFNSGNFFETASYYALGFGFLTNLAAGASGFFSWRVTYEAQKTRTFTRKILFSVLLVIIGGTCLIWRTIDPNVLVVQNYLSYFYLGLTLSLVPIIAILGRYGGEIVFP